MQSRAWRCESGAWRLPRCVYTHLRLDWRYVHKSPAFKANPHDQCSHLDTCSPSAAESFVVSDNEAARKEGHQGIRENSMGRFAIQPLGMEVWPNLASAIEHVMVCGILLPVDFIIGPKLPPWNQYFKPEAKIQPGRHVAKPPMSLGRCRMRFFKMCLLQDWLSSKQLVLR